MDRRRRSRQSMRPRNRPWVFRSCGKAFAEWLAKSNEKGGSSWQVEAALSVLDAPFVELFAEPKLLYRALDAAKARVLAFASLTAKIGLAIGGIGGAILTPLAKLFTDAVKEGASVELLAQRFNTTAESISTLRGAFAEAGVPAEEFAGILDNLSTKISHAADANEFLHEGLRSIGTGRQLIGQGIDKQIDLIVEALSKIPRVEDRIRAANELGLGGLIPFLKKGKAGLDEFRAAAENNGLITSTADAKAALEIQREYNKTMLAVRATLISVGKALLPVGKDFAYVGEEIRKSLAETRAFVGQNKAVVVAIAAGALALVGLGTALGIVSTAALVAIPILAAVKLSIGLLYALIAPLTGTVGLLTVGVIAAAAALVYLFSQTERGARALTPSKTAFGSFVDFVKGSAGSIGDALKANNWTLAIEIGIATLRVTWTLFVAGAQKAWNSFSDGIVNVFDSATKDLQKTFLYFGAFILRNTLGVLTDIITEYNRFARKLGTKEIELDVTGNQPNDDNINAVRDREEKRLDDEFNARKARRKAENKEEERDNYNAALEAQRKLDELKKQAAKEAAESAQGEGAFERLRLFALAHGKPVGSGGGTLPSLQTLFASTKGIFGGFGAQQQLGYGDQLGQRQLDAAVNTENNTAQAAANTGQIAQTLNGIAAGGVWQ